MMKFYSLLALLLAYATVSVHAQQLTEVQRQKLYLFADSASQVTLQKRASAVEWARANNVALRIEHAESGKIRELQYLDELGRPVYYETFNAGAAGSTGTSALYQEGGLGLNLSGKGMKVGVWDGGNVYDHREFTGRYLQVDGAITLSDHATHVTGTIIGGGVTANARGMAYEAEAVTYDWTSDLAEMAMEASKGLLLSNHSYGTVVGWYYNSASSKWVWSGGATADEDFRFGYYNSKSRAIDELAYNAPHYLIVWAAGNDRNDIGDGSKPADGPFDSIGPECTAKNNLAVGAVRKIEGGYTRAGDVLMSTFSSWGPVDDGRIKPDICGVGVEITSASSSGASSYSVKSGTSMAAPNVTGSLLLLQQLYSQLYPGKFMRSATLKALAIHTASEAGIAEGPDYIFGWGLLNTKAAASLLLEQAKGRQMIEELVLKNNEVIEFTIDSDGIQPIRATISWTDLPGTSPAPTLDNPAPMLVNDLDIRIFDAAGREYKPYILDPAQPGEVATKGDNFRDNVEQVYIKNPEAQRYTVRISHKRNLVNKEQAFSLILEHGASEPGPTTYYWVGGSGNFDDAAHWSLTSGGEAAGRVPGAQDHVIFDEHSFPEEAAQVLLNKATTVNSLRWYAEQPARLVFEDAPTLHIQRSFLVASKNLEVEGEGTIYFTGQYPFNQVDLNAAATPDVKLVFDNATSQWTLLSALNVKEITVLGGKLSATNLDLSVGTFALEGPEARLSFKDTRLLNLQEVRLACENGLSQLDNIRASFDIKENKGSLLLACGSLEEVRVENGELHLAGQPSIKSIEVKGSLVAHDDIALSSLYLRPGSSLYIANNTTVRVIDSLYFNGETDKPVVISALSGQASLEYAKRAKVCSDYIVVQGINAITESVFNAGAHGQIDAFSAGWEADDCENVLYPDFTYDYNCVGAIMRFTNISSGNPDRYEWDLGMETSSVMLLDDFEPSIIYPSAETYTVRLRLYRGSKMKEISRSIAIRENSLRKPVIVANDDILTATTPAPVYQWFLNDEPIEGATGRSYNTNGQYGSYRVAVYDASCNTASDVISITGIEENEVRAGMPGKFSLFPNPARNSLHLTFTGQIRWATYTIYDIRGALMFSGTLEVNQVEADQLDISLLGSGIYLLRITTNTSNQIVKFIKE